MSYRPSSKPPETEWARHLDQVRRDRNWSATQLFRAVREKLNLGPDSRSTFVAELHHDPKPHWKPGLIELFGEPPQTAPEAPQATETADPLVTALRDQTLALTALVGELQKWRTEDRKRLAQVEAMLDKLVPGSLGAPDTQAATEPHVPDGTTG